MYGLKAYFRAWFVFQLPYIGITTKTVYRAVLYANNQAPKLNIKNNLVIVVDSTDYVYWWLKPRAPDQEVGDSSSTLVKPCCFLEQGTFTPQKSTDNTQEAVAPSQHE